MDAGQQFLPHVLWALGLGSISGVFFTSDHPSHVYPPQAELAREARPHVSLAPHRPFGTDSLRLFGGTEVTRGDPR